MAIPPSKSLKTKNFSIGPRVEGGKPVAAAAASGTTQLQQARNSNPARDAELLLRHATGLSRIDLILRPEEQMTPDQEDRYCELLARRAAHEPIQYILGEREFYGLSLRVTPAVLIPRPETEHLVEATLERIPPGAPFRIADIGTGSGAIAVAIAVHRPKTQLTAIDISAAALLVARQNAEAHAVATRIEFRQTDLLDGIVADSFDMIVSNPPYIADGERETLDAEVKDYEPAKALFAGPTGIEIYQRLIPQAAKSLKPNGWLLLEIGAGQQLQLQQLLKDWNSVSFIADLQGIPRVALAQRP